MHYCYLFRVNTRKNKYETVKKQLSPEMKREIRKLNVYISEMALIAKQNFETTEDVKTFIANTENKIKEASDKRQKYRNKLRNCKDEKIIAEYKETISAYTRILQDCWKDIKTANLIIQDTERIKENIKIQKQYEKDQQETKKSKNKNRNKIRNNIWKRTKICKQL